MVGLNYWCSCIQILFILYIQKSNTHIYIASFLVSCVSNYLGLSLNKLIAAMHAAAAANYLLE